MRGVKAHQKPPLTLCGRRGLRTPDDRAKVFLQQDADDIVRFLPVESKPDFAGKRTLAVRRLGPCFVLTFEQAPASPGRCSPRVVVPSLDVPIPRP